MKTTVEKEGATKVKLHVEAEATELAKHHEDTFKRLATEVKVPGFRQGKVPRKVIEGRLGPDAVREELLKDVVPQIYLQAIQEEKIPAITQPEIEVTTFSLDGPLQFTATLEIKPEIDLPSYEGIEVTKPKIEVGEQDVDKQLELLRNRFGTLEQVGRNATQGDYAVIDISASRHDEVIESVASKDITYEVGSGTLIPELDTELLGKRPGDILKFNATLPEGFGEPHGGQEVTFTVIVKEIQAKRLPALDDEFAKTASEFDTLDELKADLREKLAVYKDAEADAQVRQMLVEDLIDRTDLEIPESLVNHELQHHLASMLAELERVGMPLERYLELNGQTQEELVEAYREASRRSVAADLVMEAVAKAEDLTVRGEEIEAEITKVAERLGKEPVEVTKEIGEGGVRHIAADILRRKTLDVVVEKAKINESSE